MPKDTRRSGFSLVLVGLATVVFFLLTDPKWGVVSRSASDVVDAINQASPGTYVGIAGGSVVALIGVWLMRRRAA